MSTSRLTQKGVGGTPYTWPVDVELSTANWGWTAYPIGVAYSPDADSRLTQMGVPGAAYPRKSGGEVIDLTSDSWGWTAYNITIPGENFYLKTDNWGWAPQKPTICSQDPSGYAYSFNSHVWPSCVFNEHVFGPRTATEIDFAVHNWGWQPYALSISFEDPIDVSLQLANWGWTSIPVGVSFGTDVGLTIAAYGWQPFNLTVELPYDIDLQAANWGWASIPVGVSYSYDTGLTIASYGWQPFPLTIDVPSLDVNLRKADWGWKSFPISVRQTSLLQGDIDAIAEAVWQKMQAEGAVQQWLETWQRQGCDASYPQDIPPSPGQYIECGGMRIYVERMPDGKIRHTRQ